MADATPSLPATRFAPLAAIAALIAAALPTLVDELPKGPNIAPSKEAPLLSQEAATALQLQSLGRWH